ncbi:MAG: TraR/DksA C4-type zinc finger protein [Anaerolineae bacterium]|nr:TraR/DksA C4-type zinc finger protein [Anaerolineae bacterium]
MPVNYAELRRRLQVNEKDLQSQLHDLQREVREEGVGYSNHMADAGTEVFEQELDMGLAKQLKQSYDAVREALHKFEDGTYGLCESCGTRIELARLEAMPEARYCLSCQSRLENRFENRRDSRR